MRYWLFHRSCAWRIWEDSYILGLMPCLARLLWFPAVFAVLARAADGGPGSRAGELNRAGRFAEAEQTASRALERDPRDARAMRELAVAKAGLAIALEPTQADAYAVRASAYLDLELYDLALSDLQQAAARDARYGPILRKYEDAAARTRENSGGDESAAEPPTASGGRAGGAARASLILSALFGCAGLVLAAFAGRRFLRETVGARLAAGVQACVGAWRAYRVRALRPAAMARTPPQTAPGGEEIIATAAARPPGAAQAPVAQETPVISVDAPKSPPPDPEPWTAGRLIDERYRLVETLFSGPRGPAWLAQDATGGRDVVLRRCAPAGAADARSVRFEAARRLAALEHPGILRIVAVVDDGGDPLLAYEWWPGRSLDLVMAEVRKLDFAEARWILQSVCAALGYAHERGVCHWSLKPSNVLIPLEGPAKLTDFWADGEPPPPADEPGDGAPELRLGQAGPWTDVYALGRCLREMVSGADWANPSIQRVAAKAMSERPQGRHASAAEFYAALERIAV